MSSPSIDLAFDAWNDAGLTHKVFSGLDGLAVEIHLRGHGYPLVGRFDWNDGTPTLVTHLDALNIERIEAQ